MVSLSGFKSAFRKKGRREEPDVPVIIEHEPELQQQIHEQLLTTDQLAQSMGQRPKSDTLGGLWKRSPRYKAIVESLDEVNEIVAVSTIGSIGGKRGEREELTRKLNELADGARSYLTGHKGRSERQTQKADAMKALLRRTELAIAVLADPDVDELPNTVTLSQAIQMKVCGVQFKDVNFDDFPDEDLDRENSEDEFGSGNANTVSKLVYGEDDEARTLIFKPEPETDTNPLLAQGVMGIDLGAPHYGERNIASQKLDELLGGHTVVKSRMILHEGQLGLLMDKADGRMPGERKKVPVSKPQQSFINGILDVETRSREESVKMLKSMEFVEVEGDEEGETKWMKVEPAYADPFEGNPPNDDLKASIQQQLCGLEWSDALTGQFDRHGENYLISFDRGTGTATVTGIDNDLAFGKQTTEIPPPGPDPTTGYNGVGLPVFIDRTTFTRIDALDFDDDMLPELHGRLGDEEIEATRRRFTTLQRHARKLAKDGFVVDNWKTWRSPDDQTATEYLESQETTNSYYMRDIHEHTV